MEEVLLLITYLIGIFITFAIFCYRNRNRGKYYDNSIDFVIAIIWPIWWFILLPMFLIDNFLRK